MKIYDIRRHVCRLRGNILKQVVLQVSCIKTKISITTTRPARNISMDMQTMFQGCFVPSVRM